jgi:hypothetical protein
LRDCRIPEIDVELVNGNSYGTEAASKTARVFRGPLKGKGIPHGKPAGLLDADL